MMMRKSSMSTRWAGQERVHAEKREKQRKSAGEMSGAESESLSLRGRSQINHLMPRSCEFRLCSAVLQSSILTHIGTRK